MISFLRDSRITGKFKLNKSSLMKSITRFLLGLCVFVGSLSSCTPTPGDLVLRGGKIATVDENFDIHQALVVRGDKIAFVGSDADDLA